MTSSTPPARAGDRATSRVDAIAIPSRTARRLGLVVLLLAAAMPVRIPVSVGIINSVSILDLLLVGAAATLYVRVVLHRLSVGYPELFLLLVLAPAASAVSLAWSRDVAATARSTLIYLESLIAYLYVVNETAELPCEQIVTYMKRWVYLLILPGILLLLHVPGFAPQATDLSPTSGDYLSYYTRLSHPILGRSNNLATVLAFFVPPLLYWGMHHRATRFTVAGIVALIAVFLTLSRGVILALVVVGVLYWLSSRDFRWRPRGRRGSALAGVGVASLVLAAIVGLYELNPATSQFFSGRFSTVNFTQRIDLLSTGIRSLIRSPLLGYGGGVTPDPGLQLGVHNTYLQQLIYYGLPLGVLIGVSLLLICRFFFAASTRDVGRVLGFSVLGQLFVFVFESSFEGTVLKVLFYLSIGLAVGLLRAAELEADSPTGPKRQARAAR